MSADRSARLTIDLPTSAHKKLKMAAFLMGTSMKDLVLMSVENFIHRKFNKKTEKVLKDARRGKGVKKFPNLEALFDDLGI